MNRPDGRDKVAAAAQKINKLVDELGPLPRRMSDLLAQHRGRRRVRAAAVSPRLRSLEFIQAELSGLVDSLRQLQLSRLGPDHTDNNDFDKWFYALGLMLPPFNSYLDRSDQAARFGCHRQLHRAAAYGFLRAAGLPLPFLRGVQELEETVSLLAERPFRYRDLRPDGDGDGTTTTSTQTQPHADGEHLVGIEEALRNKVVRRFMDAGDGNRDLRAIAIVGPAGVGKTTLARAIYSELQGRGQCCATASVVVSLGSGRKELLEKILSMIRLQREITTYADEHELAHDISTHLQDKRYIILIDDIWEESDWDAIKDVFPQNNRASRIIVTTRLGSVASVFGDVHEVKPLCRKDSNVLFFRRSFDREVSIPSHLQQLCDEILRRCSGIPLFITRMADWLKEEGRPEEEYVKLPAMLEEFERVLSPAYDNLPYWMKVPLLYVSMFPDGYMFGKESFTEKLAAELLADPSRTAEDYFEQLVDRNIISRVKKVEEAEGCWQWQVNYFMLQFLALKSADKGFAHTSGTLNSVEGAAASSSGSSSGGGKKPRRLSLHQPHPDLPALLAEIGLSHTRSLAVSGTVGSVPLDKLIFLMVLDLEGWQCFQDQNWLPICQMYLLRFLSLRNTAGVTAVPPEIKELRKLVTLDLSHTEISELPPQVCELSELRMFDLSGTPVMQLPEGIRKMRQLRRLLLLGGNTVTELPEEIGNLHDLDTLAVDLTGCSASLVVALGRIWKLRVVAMTLSSRQSTDLKFLEVLCSSVEKWRKLESLTVDCRLGCSMEFLGSCLSTLSVSLKKFACKSVRLFTLPTWLGRLHNLAFIEINVYKLSPADLSTLGKLPILESLVLGLHLLPEKAIVIVGENRYFPRLQELSIRCRVPWMTFRKGAMPELTHLELNIGGSPASGKNVPSGIVNLQSLSDVALNYSKCYDESANVRETIEALKKGVVNHHKMINLVINGIITSQQQDN